MNITKFLYPISMGIITLAVLMMLGAAWLAFVPIKVVKPQTQPYKVLTNPNRPGHTLIYEVDICKFREVPTTVLRRFVDEKGTSFPLPPQQSNITKGCGRVNVPVILPTLHPGKWYLALDVSYKVNPLRTEYYHLRTEKFDVVEN